RPRSLPREKNLEVRALSAPVHDNANPAAVRLHHLPSDGQAHASTSLLSGEKRLEDKASRFGRDAGAVVGKYQFAVTPGRRDHNPDFRRFDAASPLERVRHENL